ncbi:unnamed protein product [Cylicostephanus goldi]|uniref:Uncharacterized protein n=1 Tax=Cylicostephanus goldi TaxID=71465 RepID=A0A3P6R3P5_CYLGO|nr:unnamed protein product [Cylicostephanus goldi]
MYYLCAYAIVRLESVTVMSILHVHIIKGIRSPVTYVAEHSKERWTGGGTGKHITPVSSRISTVSH